MSMKSPFELVKVPVSHYEDKGQLSDGSRKLVLYTQEISPEAVAEIARYTRTAGWFVFSPNKEDIIEKEIPEEQVDPGTSKSSSQRLYHVMYRYWELCTSKNTPFPIWREAAMEKEINRWKSLLP